MIARTYSDFKIDKYFIQPVMTEVQQKTGYLFWRYSARDINRISWLQEECS
jgi:hypothetical protein